MISPSHGYVVVECLGSPDDDRVGRVRVAYMENRLHVQH